MRWLSQDPIPTRPSLLGRLKDWNNQQSWEDFKRIYWRLIVGFARKRGLNEAEAEDVAQETLLAVAKQMECFEYRPSECSFKSWLFSITNRKVSDHYRRAQRHNEVRTMAQAHVAITERPLNSGGTEQQQIWEAEWQETVIAAALKEIKLRVKWRQYQMFYLHVGKCQSISEVAKALGVSKMSVSLAKHRIMPVFRKAVRRLEENLYGK